MQDLPQQPSNLNRCIRTLPNVTKAINQNYPDEIVKLLRGFIRIGHSGSYVAAQLQEQENLPKQRGETNKEEETSN